MFVVYNNASNEIVGVSGYRNPERPLTDDELNRVHPEVDTEQETFLVTDIETILSVWESLDAGAKIELEFTEGTPSGIKAYKPITVIANPNPVVANAEVAVTATIPLDTPDTEVTFQAEEGAAYTKPVTNGQASHIYVFTLPGSYHINVSSQHHGMVNVEVVVQ